MFYPGFNYVKIWADLTNIAGVHLDYKITANVDGRQLVWDDIYTRRSGVLSGGYPFDIESIFDTFVRLYVNI